VHDAGTRTPVQNFGDGTLLTIFPNPIASGQDVSIFIGNIEGESQLNITDENGKIVGTYPITKANAIYFLPTTSIATGMYQLSLVQDSKVREFEKMVVE
jgi:hypothetical protein